MFNFKELNQQVYVVSTFKRWKITCLLIIFFQKSFFLAKKNPLQFILSYDDMTNKKNKRKHIPQPLLYLLYSPFAFLTRQRRIEFCLFIFNNSIQLFSLPNSAHKSCATTNPGWWTCQLNHLNLPTCICTRICQQQLTLLAQTKSQHSRTKRKRMIEKMNELKK